MIERTKVMDTLYMKHKVKMVDLQKAQKQYDLENDEELKQNKNLTLAAREKLAKENNAKMRKELAMTEEEQKEIREACEALGEVNVTPNSTGKIDVNEWLKLLGVSVKLQVRFLARIEEKHRHERRAAMNEDN